MTYPLGNPSSDFTSGIYTSDFSPAIVCGAIIDNHTPINNVGMKNSVGYHLSLVENFVNTTYLGRVNTPVGTAYITNLSGLYSQIEHMYGSGDLILSIDKSAYGTNYTYESKADPYNMRSVYRSDGGGFQIGQDIILRSAAAQISISGYSGSPGAYDYSILDINQSKINSYNITYPGGFSHGFDIRKNKLDFGTNLKFGASGYLYMSAKDMVQVSGSHCAIFGDDRLTIDSDRVNINARKQDLTLQTFGDNNIHMTSNSGVALLANNNIGLTSSREIGMAAYRDITLWSSVLGGTYTVKVKNFLELIGTNTEPPNANQAIIWSSGTAGGQSIYVQDGAGFRTKISPHNAAGEWVYESTNANTGRSVSVNMEQLVRFIDEKFGTTFYNVTEG